MEFPTNQGVWTLALGRSAPTNYAEIVFVAGRAGFRDAIASDSSALSVLRRDEMPGIARIAVLWYAHVRHACARDNVTVIARLGVKRVSIGRTNARRTCVGSAMRNSISTTNTYPFDFSCSSLVSISLCQMPPKSKPKQGTKRKRSVEKKGCEYWRTPTPRPTKKKARLEATQQIAHVQTRLAKGSKELFLFELDWSLIAPLVDYFHRAVVCDWHLHIDVKTGLSIEQESMAKTTLCAVSLPVWLFTRWRCASPIDVQLDANALWTWMKRFAPTPVQLRSIPRHLQSVTFQLIHDERRIGPPRHHQRLFVYIGTEYECVASYETELSNGELEIHLPIPTADEPYAVVDVVSNDLAVALGSFANLSSSTTEVDVISDSARLSLVSDGVERSIPAVYYNPPDVEDEDDDDDDYDHTVVLLLKRARFRVRLLREGECLLPLSRIATLVGPSHLSDQDMPLQIHLHLHGLGCVTRDDIVQCFDWAPSYGIPPELVRLILNYIRTEGESGHVVVYTAPMIRASEEEEEADLAALVETVE